VDYLHQPLTFRARKAIRYVELYGARRTLVKVRSQYHMGASYAKLPPERGVRPGQHVGVLGCGKFAYAQIAWYLHHAYGETLRGVMDLKPARAASLAVRYGAGYHTGDAQRILDDPEIDLIYIASNHASHAEYAVDALRRGKHVHIEKPHVVRMDQLERLVDAMRSGRGKVALGFNRPLSRMGRLAQSTLAAQDGATMLNWFVAGHEISPDHWYFREEEGGRVLGNLCHWTDFCLQMVPPECRYPVTIRPTRAESSDCDIAVTYVFGDGSIAAITFSAKGHAFEGVKERFAAHRGRALVVIDDFKTLRIDVGERRRRVRSRTRDHGHKDAICRSYEMSRTGSALPGASVDYVWQTGELFLQTKEALERDEVVVLDGQRRFEGVV
jgi:predicted dehydrogenase